MSSKEYDILRSESQAQGIIPHNWIHYSTLSYKLSLLSSQLKSFTSQWPGSTLTAQHSWLWKLRDVTRENKESEREHWPLSEPNDQRLAGNYTTAMRRHNHSSPSCVAEREKKRWWISSNVCTVRLIYLMNASLSFVSETTPSMCPPRTQRTTQEVLEGRYSGIVRGSEVHTIWELLDWTLGPSLLSSLE